MKNLIIAGAVALVTLNAFVIAKDINVPVVASTASTVPTDDTRVFLNALEVGHLTASQKRPVTVTASVIKIDAHVVKYPETRCGEYYQIGTGGHVRDCVNL
jgi:hypothetical protein